MKTANTKKGQSSFSVVVIHNNDERGTHTTKMNERSISVNGCLFARKASPVGNNSKTKEPGNNDLNDLGKLHLARLGHSIGHCLIIFAVPLVPCNN